MGIARSLDKLVCVPGCKPCNSTRDDYEHHGHAVVRLQRSRRSSRRALTRTQSARLCLENDPSLQIMKSNEAWTEHARERYESYEIECEFTLKSPRKISTVHYVSSPQSDWNSGTDSELFSPISPLISPLEGITETVGKTHHIPNVLRHDTRTTFSDEDDLDDMERGLQEHMKSLTERDTGDTAVTTKSRRSVSCNLYRMDSRSPSIWEEEQLDLMDTDMHKQMKVLAERETVVN